MCSVCKTGISKQDGLDLQIGGGMSFERIETFCYLGDMLSSDGGCDHAVLARINKACEKFRKSKSFLCAKRIGLNVKSL